MIEVTRSFFGPLYAILPLATLFAAIFLALRFVVLVFLDAEIVGRIVAQKTTEKDRRLLISFLLAVALFAVTPILVY